MKTLVMGLAVMGLAARGAEDYIRLYEKAGLVQGKNRGEVEKALGAGRNRDGSLHQGEWGFTFGPDGLADTVVWRSHTGVMDHALIARLRAEPGSLLAAAPSSTTKEEIRFKMDDGPVESVTLKRSLTGHVGELVAWLRETPPTVAEVPAPKKEPRDVPAVPEFRAVDLWGVPGREIAKTLDVRYPGPLGDMKRDGLTVFLNREGVASAMALRAGVKSNAVEMVALVHKATGLTLPTVPDRASPDRMTWYLAQGRISLIEVSGYEGEFDMVQWTYRY